MFNTYMTQFICSHHGILIRKRITTYLDAKGTSKKTCFFCEQLIQSKTTDFTRGRMYERVELFSIQCKIGDFHKDFYIQQIEKLAYHRTYHKILGKIMLLTLDIKHLNTHQATSVFGQIMPNGLALNPAVNYGMKYLITIVPYPWKVDVYIAS